jgi:thiol-disulfide isomerase/thioredoxin
MLTRASLAGLLLIACLLGGAGLTLTTSTAQEKPRKSALEVGAKAANSNSLRDVRGNRRPLHDFKGHKALVLVFVGSECPVSNLYLPELIELEKRYRPKGVQFVGVYPNHGDDLETISGHSYDRDATFPVVLDTSARLADSLGVTRVPTVAVLDGGFVLRYRGRVDDRYGVATKRPKASRADLAEALDEVLAGKQVTTAETETDGCLIARAPKAKEKTEVTYSKEVSRIIQERCQSCHRPEQSAPFALMSYDDAVKHAAMIKEVTTQRRMPPWHADPRHGKFSNDRRLSKAEIATLAAWVDAGMPKGDPNDLPKAKEFPKGWVHGTPDLVLTMPKEYEVPATGVVPYQDYFIETGFKEDKWVQLAECKPGAPSVVHHVVAYILREGQKEPVGRDGAISILVGWAPGDLGLVLPKDTAMRVPKGARIRLEMHYTPNGTKTKDKSSIGLTFAKAPPKRELFVEAFANLSIVVPPHSPHHKAEATMRLPADARLISLSPHMHWRGKHFFYETITPDGKRQPLLSVPRWDFNWQSSYRFAEPYKLPKGTKVHAVAHWDNTVNNPLNPNPKERVKFGLQSWEEMMVGFAAYVWERPETAAELAKNPPKQSDLLFDRFDVNGDDVITPDELPEQLRLIAAFAKFELPARMTRQQFAELLDNLAKLGQKKKEKKKD